jgi:acyl-coenzyme A thioesterase PaaI-like protein
MSDSPGEKRRFFRQRWEANQRPTTGIWAERRRLAAAMRVVIERLTSSDAPVEELAAAADRLEQYAEHLATHPRRQRYEGFSESALAEGGGHFDFSPLIGRANPLAPPIEVRAQDGRVHAEVVFGSAYEGPPGCLHGGYVAAAFDEVLGYAQSFTGSPGMTGRLEVVYRSPTPLHTLLRFDAWVESVVGRKITTRCTLHAGERLCAEAMGLFIAIKPGTFERLIEQREPRADADRGGDRGGDGVE